MAERSNSVAPAAGERTWPPPDIETRRRCWYCGWPVPPGQGICANCYFKFLKEAQAEGKFLDLLEDEE